MIITNDEQFFSLPEELFQAPMRAFPLEALGISVYLAEITPEIAQYLLARKNTNRTIRLQQLQRLKRAMEQARWEINGETIIFDQYGRLIEGQHRLQAVLDSGMTILALVVHGIDRHRFKTMGQGSKRTIGDILGIEGVKNSTHVGAALRWVYRYENGMMNNPHPLISEYELADTREIHSTLGDSLSFGVKCHGVAAPGMITALHYLCGKRDRGLANHFYWSLGTGENLEKGDPILVLRERIRPRQQKRVNAILRDEMKAPTIIKTWNILRKDPHAKLKNAQRIAWHGTKGEAFPKIL